MKYRIIGSNKQTSAKVTMEVEAESKAAAERKALTAGIDVIRVEDISEGAPKHAIVQGGSRRPNGSGGLMKLIILLLIAGALYYFWPQLRQLFRR